MTFMIAAAGTGGHVFPGLAVGEGLMSLGVDRDQIVFVGGNRLESTVYPKRGFRFFEVELAGLKRSVSVENLRIPSVVLQAKRAIADEIEASGIKAVLAMGGYVTIPTGLAARSERVPFFNAEQNAEAGLANRVAARWARETFLSFPDTTGLTSGSWVGNPVRSPFWQFDRARLRSAALEYYDIDGATPVLGVFGGSLGAGLINGALARMLDVWEGGKVTVVHLTGETHLQDMTGRSATDEVVWIRVGFEQQMELFYAAADLVVARSGGAVAELTATGTPSILVPGQFGSGGHQAGNALALERAGAARIVPEESIGRLGDLVATLISDEEELARMARSAGHLAKPDAARTIARAMIEAVI